MADAAAILSRHAALEAERKQFETTWQRIGEVILPSRGEFTATTTQGQRRDRNLYDATAVHANEMLAAGLHGEATNPAARWFELSVEDPRLAPSRAAREWLEEAARRMFALFSSPSSGFITANHELLLDLGAFGTAVMFVAEEGASGRIIFRTHHLRSVFVAENPFGVVDTVHVVHPMTARQVAGRFGVAALGEPARAEELLVKRPEQPVNVLHAVYPRADRRLGGLAATDMAFASVWINLERKAVIAERGYHEMPYFVPRWSKVPGETYGRGPGWTALPDTLQLQAMMETVIQAAQVTVMPTLLLADDGALAPIDLRPGAEIYGGIDERGNETVRVLRRDARPDLGLDMIQAVREKIQHTFHMPLFSNQAQPVKTATQIIQEAEERMQLMGPALGRLQAEYLGPLIDRVFALLMRAGAFPPPPPELAGAALAIEYLSPAARAQRARELGAITRTMEVLAPLVPAKPEILSIFDGENLARHVADLAGVPAKVLFDAQTVARMRAAERQVTEQAAGQASLAQGAAAAVDLAKAQALAGGAGGAA